VSILTNSCFYCPQLFFQLPLAAIIILTIKLNLSHLYISNYVKGFVPRSKKTTTTDSSVGFFGREIFRDNFLNGIFLNQSFLPKSSLATWVGVKLGLPRLG
jgi:hypothetical protein